jgi:hypothetical protein
LGAEMKIHVRAHEGKVVVSSSCEGCSNGLHDILRPCPVCGLTVLGKRNLRASLFGTDRAIDSVVFFGAPPPSVLP